MPIPMLYLLAAANEVGEEQNENAFWLLLFLAAIIVLFIWVIWFASFLNKFQRELRHINARIEQSITERERMHYVRRRRRLFLSLIPFVPYHRYSRRHRKQYPQDKNE